MTASSPAATSSQSGSIVELVGVGKRYGDATVLSGVDLSLRGGVVHGLIGRNGAGKSTLVGILMGRHAPDSGKILIEGVEHSLGSPARATELGVVAVPQELVLPMQMSVREAVTLGAEPNRRGIISLRRERHDVEKILDRLGLHLDIEARVSSLPVSWQKMVLVAQLLHRNARVIAFDEPTSAMNSEDTERVLQLVEVLRGVGVAVLYISHRLDEVERLCDEVTVLRDGRTAAALTKSQIDKTRLVQIMMQVDSSVPQAPHHEVEAQEVDAAGDHLLASSVSSGILRDFALDVAPGELVGVTGLPGSGIEEAFATLSGVTRPRSGAVQVGPHSVRSLRSAVRLGVATLPASRREVILAEESVPENMVLGSLSHSSRATFLSSASVARFCRSVAARLGLTPVYDRRIGQLSGGNQQRALVGGRILTRPRFLVLEDPTVGVDIAARQELHDVLRALAVDGIGIVVGSSDPQELALLCDRVLVIRSGGVVAELSAAGLTEYALTEALTGASQASRPPLPAKTHLGDPAGPGEDDHGTSPPSG